MYWRRILCTLQIAVDLCSAPGWGGGGGTWSVGSKYTSYRSPLHHFEGHWKWWALKIETFLGSAILRAVGRGGPWKIKTFLGPKSLDFPLPMVFDMDLSASKSLRPAPYTVNNRYITSYSVEISVHTLERVLILEVSCMDFLKRQCHEILCFHDSVPPSPRAIN